MLHSWCRHGIGKISLGCVCMLMLTKYTAIMIPSHQQVVPATSTMSLPWLFWFWSPHICILKSTHIAGRIEIRRMLIHRKHKCKGLWSDVICLCASVCSWISCAVCTCACVINKSLEQQQQVIRVIYLSENQSAAYWSAQKTPPHITACVRTQTTFTVCVAITLPPILVGPQLCAHRHVLCCVWAHLSKNMPGRMQASMHV